jgi:Tol biopolymer transport system component
VTDDRLDSWKEIAAYLRTSLRSVQRWEKTEGLPVHRHQHLKSSTVFAYRSELEAWRVRRADLFAAPAGLPHRRLLLTGGVAVVLIAAALVLWRPWRKPSPPPRLLPLTSYPGHEIFPAFSPHGDQVVFSWNGPQQDQYDLYLQQVGALSPLRLTSDPADDLSPAWSPDGRTIAFLRCPRGFATMNMAPRGDAGLYLFTLPAGPERRLAAVHAVPPDRQPYGIHVTWHPNGQWLVITDRAAPKDPPGLFLVSVASGEKHRLTQPPEASNADVGPAFSPDARALTFVRVDNYTVSDIYRLDFSKGFAPAGEPRRLTFEKRFNTCPAWTADGRSIRFLSGHLRAAQHMSRIPASGSAQPETEGLAPDDAIFVAHAPPQARRLAYVRRVSDSNIWRVGDSAPILSSTRWDGNAQFSPDGRRIAFLSDRSGSFEIWVARSDGFQPLQLTSFGGPHVGGPHWSPDGEWIAFHARAEGHADIYVIRSSGGVPRRLTHHAALPNWSRDGRWIYHASERGAATRIWKTPVQGGDPISITSSTSTTSWESSDGRFLYFAKTSRDGYALWKAPVAGGPETEVLPSLANDRAFAVAAEGIYFIPKDSIQLLRFSDGSITTLAKLTKPISFGLSVSPDSRTILYGQTDHEGADLALVEIFR